MIASTTVQPNPFGPPRDATPEPQGNRIRVKNDVFRAVALKALKSVILLLRIAKRRADHAQGKPITDEELLPYATPESEPGVIAFLHGVINETFASPDAHSALHAKLVLRHLDAADNVAAMVSSLDAANRMHTDALVALGAGPYAAFTAATCRGCPSPRVAQASSSGAAEQAPTPEAEADEEDVLPAPCFAFQVGDEPDELVVTWSAELGENFLAANATVAEQLRAEKRDPTFVDFVAAHLAYHILSQGTTLFPLGMCPSGTPGFRDTQSMIVLSDPGDGHIFQTTRNADWMKDTILHVQHPESAQDRRTHTPLHDFARTRLHTGSVSPNTFFIGPALGDTQAAGFKLSKAVNAAIIAANDAFQLGAAECQLSMDGLTTSQITSFMQSVNTHARRNHKQLLSALFDVSQPLADDLTPDAQGRPTILTDPMAIALRATGLVSHGGFSIIALVGDRRGVVAHLGFKQALQVVHDAHSMGLSAQITADFTASGVRDAVHTGVDAIAGLSGMTHPSTHDAFAEAAVARAEAEASVRGRAAFLLARLDTMHHEGSITYAQAQLRVQLARVLATGNDTATHRLLSEHWPIVRALQLLPPAPRAAPCVARARRLLLGAGAREETALRRGAHALPDGAARWDEFVATLRALVDDNDEAGVFRYSRAEPWRSFHKSHTGFAMEADTYFEMPACLNPKAVPRATRHRCF